MKPLILIGYMGSGKSTIGKKLSSDLKYILFDTDALIEENEGRTINNIFATDGEEYFRNLETELLKDYIKKDKQDIIISTGGGMPVREENASLMRKLGTVIYFRATPETIYQRIKNDTSRPLLKCDDPLAKIKDMIAMRGPKYEACAHHIIDVDGKSIESVVEEIKNEIISN